MTGSGKGRNRARRWSSRPSRGGREGADHGPAGRSGALCRTPPDGGLRTSITASDARQGTGGTGGSFQRSGGIGGFRQSGWGAGSGYRGVRGSYRVKDPTGNLGGTIAPRVERG